MADCQYCGPLEDHTTPVYHAGKQVRVFECDTCGDPILTLSEHEANPSLETQAYALGVARGLFGPGAAFYEADHGTPAGHWSAHIDVPTG